MSEALWGVIIGGLIAILPPTITSIIQSLIQSKKDKKNIKRDAYDKIIRYLFHTHNWNLNTNKVNEINKFTEEASVLATLYCSIELQNKVSNYSDLFHKYVNAIKSKNSNEVDKLKEELNKSRKEIRKQITIDMGNK